MENEYAKNATLAELKSKAVEDIFLYFSSKENFSNPRIAPSMIVNLYWDLAQGFDNFKKIISNEHEKYEKIYADVVSSLENSNCSCRARFTTFVMENQDASIESYKKIINELSEDQKFFLEKALSKQETMYKHYQIEIENNQKNEEFAKNNLKLKHFSENKDGDVKNGDDSSSLNNFASNYLEGNVIEIEDSPEAYGNLIRNLRMGGEFYRGLNILQKPDNKIWIYFY